MTAQGLRRAAPLGACAVVALVAAAVAGAVSPLRVTTSPPSPVVRSYGTNGTAMLPSVRAQTAQLATALPAPGGGVFLVGQASNAVMVGRLTAAGQLDSAYGGHGVAVVPVVGATPRSGRGR